MSNFPCPNKVDCPCDPSPFLNLSSAAPDPVVFNAVAFVKVTPPLGTIAPNITCMAFCSSSQSQADADLCAQLNGLLCVVGPWQRPAEGICDLVPAFCRPVPPPLTPIGGANYLTYLNTLQSCTVECPDGNEFTYTVPAGTFGALSQLAADTEAYSYACAQAPLHRICLSDLTQDTVCKGGFLSAQITATGNFLADFNQSNTWEETGTLPGTMEFTGGAPTRDQASVQGTAPDATGSFDFTVRVTAPNGDFMQKIYTLIVAGISAPLPPANLNVPYSAGFTTFGFTSPTFQVVAGTLPDGLTMNEQGLFSGTPTATGTNSFDVLVKDGVTGFTCTETVNLQVTGSDTLCCNCGSGAKIVGFNPALFTFNPASFITLASVTFSNMVPAQDCADDAGFCTDQDIAPYGFVKSGGNWFGVQDGSLAAGCNPLNRKATLFRMSFGDGITGPFMGACDAGTLVSCYSAANPIAGTFDVLTHPYDPAYGNGAWDGTFTLTDSFGNGSCASQWFGCNHLNGWGYFGIELDAVPNGPDFDWTFTIFANPSVQGISPAFTTMWQGTMTGPTQNGVYTRTGGTMTGPATLTIGPN